MDDHADDNNETLVIDWSKLDPTDIEDRISWLRQSLVAGQDWGYCEEAMTCVIMNTAAAMMYRLRWFEAGQQSLISQPVMLNAALGKQRIMEEQEKINVW